MLWWSSVVALAVVGLVGYVHYRDQRRRSGDPQRDADGDYRQALHELTVGGSPFTLLFAWLARRRRRP